MNPGCFILLALIACSSCDLSKAPTGARPASIVVEVEPDLLDVNWSLEGPGGFSAFGTGDSTPIHEATIHPADFTTTPSILTEP